MRTPVDEEAPLSKRKTTLVDSVSRTYRERICVSTSNSLVYVITLSLITVALLMILVLGCFNMLDIPQIQNDQPHRKLQFEACPAWCKISARPLEEKCRITRCVGCDACQELPENTNRQCRSLDQNEISDVQCQYICSDPYFKYIANYYCEKIADSHVDSKVNLQLEKRVDFDEMVYLNLSLDGSMQPSYTKYTFVHVVNLFAIDGKIDFEHQISMESWEQNRAQALANGIEVIVVAVIDKNDRDAMFPYLPSEWKIVYLQPEDKFDHSKFDFLPVSPRPAFPFIDQIFNAGLDNSGSQYMVYTNVDIICGKNFYIKIAEVLEKTGMKALTVERQQVYEDDVISDAGLVAIQALGATIPHVGGDTFVLDRDFLKGIELSNFLIGTVAWDSALMKILQKKGSYGRVQYQNMSYHIGNAEEWRHSTSETISAMNCWNLMSADVKGVHHHWWANFYNHCKRFIPAMCQAPYFQNAHHFCRDNMLFCPLDISGEAEMPAPTLSRCKLAIIHTGLPDYTVSTFLGPFVWRLTAVLRQEHGYHLKNIPTTHWNQEDTSFKDTLKGFYETHTNIIFMTRLNRFKTKPFHICKNTLVLTSNRKNEDLRRTLVKKRIAETGEHITDEEFSSSIRYTMEGLVCSAAYADRRAVPRMNITYEDLIEQPYEHAITIGQKISEVLGLKETFDIPKDLIENFVSTERKV